MAGSSEGEGGWAGTDNHIMGEHHVDNKDEGMRGCGGGEKTMSKNMMNERMNGYSHRYRSLTLYDSNNLAPFQNGLRNIRNILLLEA